MPRQGPAIEASFSLAVGQNIAQLELRSPPPLATVAQPSHGQIMTSPVSDIERLQPIPVSDGRVGGELHSSANIQFRTLAHISTFIAAPMQSLLFERQLFILEGLNIHLEC
ncbi:hypothetical protein N7478_012191 [Penicillium angulare]|uniref:uncharacterized protein n=1 Tax=Penicillium angulare TaxID=116970 RepID=UPI0025401241|nr:uncharacterized protein N7478_012191 [Penicillium angulare]KAJ5260586.1 hypothetical protein N7478_012191 [Penicillium angulare]